MFLTVKLWKRWMSSTPIGWLNGFWVWEISFPSWKKRKSSLMKKKRNALRKRSKSNKFDFNDFLSQLNQIRKMGDLKSLMNMIPGMSKMTKNLDIDDSAFNKVESIIFSMTPHERDNPDRN